MCLSILFVNAFSSRNSQLLMTRDCEKSNKSTKQPTWSEERR